MRSIPLVLLPGLVACTGSGGGDPDGAAAGDAPASDAPASDAPATIDSAADTDGPPSDGASTDAAPTFPLTVTLLGTGTGRVTSNPAGIDCPGVCVASFSEGVPVTLRAQGALDHRFVEWSGACSGSAGCALTLAAPASVFASFEPDPPWVVTMGSPEFDRAFTAWMSGGDLVVAGNALGPIDFGDGFVSASGIFVARYTGDGGYVWAVSMGDQRTEVAAVAVDDADDVLIVGRYFGPTTFGTATLPGAGADDAFIVKLSGTDGAVVWARTIGGASGDTASAVATDGTDIVVAGTYSMTIDVGFGPWTAGYHAGDVFLVRFDALGTVTSGFELAKGTVDDLAIEDVTGDLVIGGIFEGAAAFGFPSAPEETNHIASYSAAGFPQWVESYTLTLGGVRPIVRGLAFSATGDLIVGAQADPSYAGDNVGIARHGPDGQDLAFTAFGLDGYQELADVAAAPDGTIVAVGWFEVTGDLGGPPLSSSGGSRDAFAAKFLPDGTHVWSRGFGWTNMERAESVSIRADGEIALAGVYAGSTMLAGTYYTNFGGGDVFVVGLAP